MIETVAGTAGAGAILPDKERRRSGVGKPDGPAPDPGGLERSEMDEEEREHDRGEWWID